MKRLFLVYIVIMLLLSCSKDKTTKPTPPPTNTVTDVFSVTLSSPTNSDITTFTLDGSLQVTSTAQDIEYGFIFSSYPNPSIYQGKVIGIGKSQKSLNYSYVITGLDTGKTYYCRAYALQNGTPVYSSITIAGKVAPYIIDVTTNNTDTTTYPTALYVNTNFKNLSPSDQVVISVDNTPSTITSVQTVSTGTNYTASFSGQLPAGQHTINVMLNGLSLNFTKLITPPIGIWTNVGQMSYNQVLFSYLVVGFVKDDWIYSYRYLPQAYPVVTTTEFIKQNIHTGQVVQLSTYSQDAHYINSPGIACVGNKVHFIGGLENDRYNNACVNLHYVYDIDKDTWATEPAFPGSVRKSAATMVYNNKIYYGLGYILANTSVPESIETERGDMWSYDTQTQQWQQLANFPDFGRMHNANFAIGSKLYVVAGFNRFNAEQSTWCYDAANNTWAQKANFPGAGFEDPACFQIGNYGYVGLGTEGLEPGGVATVSLNFFRYDSQKDQWTKLNDLAYYTQYAICGSDGKYGIIAGGFPVYGNAQDIYTYTP
jgi:hypothetical protein